MECVPITAQYSVTWYLKYVINRKIQILVCVESELEAWEVHWARSVLSHELQHSKYQNCECRKVASLTLAIAIADVMTGFTNWIPGQQVALWPCPRPFPSVRNRVWPRVANVNIKTSLPRNTYPHLPLARGGQYSELRCHTALNQILNYGPLIFVKNISIKFDVLSHGQPTYTWVYMHNGDKKALF